MLQDSNVNDKMNQNFMNESMRSSYRGVDSHEKIREGMAVPI